MEVRLATNFLKSQVTSKPCVWASDLQRASDSARLMCELLNLPAPDLCSELRQRSWGTSEGRSYDERVGELAYLGPPGRDLPSDAEPTDRVMSRLTKFVNQLRAIGHNEHVVVSHNELLNYLLDLFRGGPLRKRHLLGGEVMRVDLNPDGLIVGRPQSVFPHRLVYLPDVRNFFNNSEAIQHLRDHDLEPVSNVKLNEEYNVVGVILGDTQFGIEDALRFPRLRVVSRFGTGVNNVAVDALWSQRHVTVARTPQVNTRAVAGFAVAMLIVLLRDALSHASGLREDSGWRVGSLGRELSEVTVGVIGCGPIGLEVVRCLYREGAKVLVWNRTWPPRGALESDLSAMSQVKEIRDLVRSSDAISLHVAYVSGTHHLFNHAAFEAMRESGRKPVLVNTSRGQVVDETALLSALNDGVLKAAAIDVWSQEGADRNDVVLALRRHPAVFPTPHIAGRTLGVTHRASKECARNTVALVEGRRSEVQDSIVVFQQAEPASRIISGT